jgi:hypothetical protein
MEIEIVLPYSQAPATGPFLVPDYPVNKFSYVQLCIPEHFFSLIMHVRHLSRFHQTFQAHIQIILEGRCST